MSVITGNYTLIQLYKSEFFLTVCTACSPVSGMHNLHDCAFHSFNYEFFLSVQCALCSFSVCMCIPITGLHEWNAQSA